jgi:hypothetical protein
MEHVKINDSHSHMKSNPLGLALNQEGSHALESWDTKSHISPSALLRIHSSGTAVVVVAASMNTIHNLSSTAAIT